MMRYRASVAVLLVTGLAASAVLLLTGCGGGGSVSKEFTPTAPLTKWDTAEWANTLSVVCTADGFVRYDDLKSNTGNCRDSLFRYVGMINQASPDNRPELFPSAGDKLAYWINAYNALCMYDVYQRGMPENVAKAGAIPYAIFYTDKFPVGGVSMNLDGIEKTKVRSVGDPRIHFALNCMSYSCPPLLKEPYDGARLDAQFDAQGRRYLSDPRGAQSAGGTKVKLSEIFTRFYTQEWKDAYTKKTGKKEPGLLEAIRPYAGPDSPVQNATEYESMDYNWSLNRAK
jgi:hypothetical protein